MKNNREGSLEIREKTKFEKRQKDGTVFAVFMESLQYLLQSMQGRYGLETYLDILGEWIDSQIRNWEEMGFVYIGGEVTVTADKSRSDILVEVFIVFEDENQKRKLRRMVQSVGKRKFTKETIERLEEVLEMKFEIEPPF